MWNVDRAFQRTSQYNLLEKCIGHDCPPCQNLERSGIFHSPRNLEHFASRLYRSRHRTKYLSSARLSFQFEDSFVRLGKNSTTPTTKVLLPIFLVKISFFDVAYLLWLIILREACLVLYARSIKESHYESSVRYNSKCQRLEREERKGKKEENEGRTVDKASVARCTVSNNGDLQSVAKDTVIARVPSGEV